jgi:hypothetical protein
VDRDNVRELGVPRMPSAKTAGKNIWNRINIKGGKYKE